MSPRLGDTLRWCLETLHQEVAVVTIGLTRGSSIGKQEEKLTLGLPPWLTGQPPTLQWPNVFSQATDSGITHQILGFVLIWRHHLKSSAILWTQSVLREPTSFGHVQSGKARSFESIVLPGILDPNPPDCTGEYLLLGGWEGWSPPFQCPQSWPCVKSPGDIS